MTEAFNWQHGTFLGATASSETTAAAAGKVGQLRRDPMAMLPFCGYHMGDYFGYWLKIGQTADASKLPKIFYVNWFRQNEHGRFLWPGYGENSRVLEWIFDRCAGRADAIDTAIGRLPEAADLDTEGLKVSPQDLATLLSVDIDGWLAEVPRIKEHFAKFGDHLPEGLRREVEDLEHSVKLCGWAVADNKKQSGETSSGLEGASGGRRSSGGASRAAGLGRARGSPPAGAACG